MSDNVKAIAAFSVFLVYVVLMMIVAGMLMEASR